jgi:HAD superfamily hydrolase (TIGR01509 family)
MRKVKAVIFDMDGLIVDTEIIESIALSKVIEGYGKTPQILETGLVHIVGGAEKTYIELMERHEITETFEIFSSKKRDIFTKLLEKRLTPFEGLLPLITLLKKNKIKIALASNRFEEHIYIILKNLGVNDHFTVVVGPSDERRHKPHPDIYLHTAKELGIKPEECVVLEDSETGVLSAKAAGMKVVAIPNKYTVTHNFEKADIITKSLADVNIQLLNSL